MVRTIKEKTDRALPGEREVTGMANGKTVKKMKVPHTFIIIFALIVAAVILTWIIPAGMYDFVKNASGKKKRWWIRLPSTM